MRRALITLAITGLILAGLPGSVPPALAFFEDVSNNFFGSLAGQNTDAGQAFANSFFGGQAGEANVSGDNNAFFGRQAGLNNTASHNSFFGAFAGQQNVTGSNNAFFGVGAGLFNTASDNAFFGAQAGDSNTSGTQNAFFGTDAGGANQTGSSNTFFGRSAGALNTASFNSFFGARAGDANTSGTDNAFFGTDAGGSNQTGSNNAFFGHSAGPLNIASDNSFFGAFAGDSNTTGTENTFFGRSAGRSNETGSSNAFFGRAAGLNNTASSNSFFGANTGDANTTGLGNAFFGASAGGVNETGGGNAFFGTFTGPANTSGSENVFVGGLAGASNTTESANSFIGAGSNGTGGITNATALGHRAQVLQSNSVVLGSITGLNGAASDTRVGIGTPSPEGPLHVRRTDGSAKVLVEEASGVLEGRELFELVNNGAARFRVRNTSNNAVWDFQSSSNAGSFVIDRVGGPVSLDFELQPDGDLVLRGSATATSFITSSDRNLKTDITPADATKLMALVKQLDISTWRFKDEPQGTINLGPMAQDFHRLFGMGTDTTIDVRDLAALALVAAQAQQEVNEELRTQLDELREAVANLSS